MHIMFAQQDVKNEVIAVMRREKYDIEKVEERGRYLNVDKKRRGKGSLARS
jgi:hypothetical protein